MDEVSRYAVGIDVGTENVRAIVMSVSRDGATSVVGYGEAQNSGMRKGVVANLIGPAEAIDRMLVEVERMSGHEINSAYLSINGAHVLSTKTEGMIALGPKDHEITDTDLARVEESATTGRIPANRDVLDVLPMGYILDGQSGIRDPLGMTGSRLEIRANVLSALTPNCANLRKAAEVGKVHAERLIPSVVASARAVLSERQMENGVAVVDFGAATTSVAIFEEGDLQYVGVLPVGSNNVTNDLAIVLEIDTESAEDIKRRFVTGNFSENSDKDIVVKRGREELRFKRAEVNKIVQARLQEIFTGVRNELKRAGYERRLPEGVVLVGGGTKLRDIEVFAKEVLESATRIGVPSGLGGVADGIEKPEFSAAVGLALYAAEFGSSSAQSKKKSKKSANGLFGFLKKI